MDEPKHASSPWDEGLGYAMATILLRLPGHAPMLFFNHIVDIPLIVPHAKLTQQEVRKLQIHSSQPVSPHCHCTTPYAMLALGW